MRIVTLAVVCKRPRRVTKFVRHAECVDAAFARIMLRSHGKVENVPVVGAVDMVTMDVVRETFGISPVRERMVICAGLVRQGNKRLSFVLTTSAFPQICYTNLN